MARWQVLARDRAAIASGFGSADGTGHASAGGMRKEIQERAYRFSLEVARNVLRTGEGDGTAAREWKRQLAKSATSVSANLEEAHNAASKADFRARIGIARKEAAESWYWLRLLSDLTPSEELARLCQEATELTRILSAIARTAKGN